jgi:hypothetical protein
MRRKFPPNSKVPRIHNPRAPYEVPWEQRSPEAIQYNFELGLLSPAQLRQAASEERAREVAEWVAKAQDDDRTQFFNQPTADANLTHWARMDFWTLEEALALSFGKAPEVVTADRMKALSAYSPFVVEYRRRAEVARRAVIAQQMWESVQPAIFLRWAERKGMNPPAAVVEAVEAAGGVLFDWRDGYERLKASSEKTIEAKDATIAAREGQIAAYQGQIQALQASAQAAPKQAPPAEPALRTRERDSLLRLIIGMAIKGYSYDPKAGRSPVPNEIAGDLELLGIGLDPDTVRKYLNDAKQLLPRLD